MTANSNETELIKYWFDELKATHSPYKEPILKKDNVEFIKLVCETLKQDAHVFAMAVNIIEKYMVEKRSKKGSIPDVLLLIKVVIFICSKNVGEQSELKIKSIIALYERLTSEKISTSKIKASELEVLNTLNHELPLTSEIDDLKLFYEVYVKPMKLKVELLNLCEKIFQLICINRFNLFFKIKKMYTQNDLALTAFQSIVSNNLYLPAGIILSAFRLTKYQNFVDLRKIELELSEITGMHYDHLQLLSNYIVDLIGD